MKSKRFGFFTLLAAIVLMLGIVFMPCAQAQVTPTTYSNFAGTGVSNLWANLYTYTINSTAVELRKGAHLTFMPFVQGVAGSTNLAVFTFQVSADGSNWTTSTNVNSATSSPGLTASIALAASASTHAPFFVFSPDKLGGARYIRLATLETANTNTVTNVRMQWSRFE